MGRVAGLCPLPPERRLFIPSPTPYSWHHQPTSSNHRITRVMPCATLHLKKSAPASFIAIDLFEIVLIVIVQTLYLYSTYTGIWLHFVVLVRRKTTRPVQIETYTGLSFSSSFFPLGSIVEAYTWCRIITFTLKLIILPTLNVDGGGGNVQWDKSVGKNKNKFDAWRRTLSKVYVIDCAQYFCVLQLSTILDLLNILTWFSLN